jgi:hypothetical protein
MRGRAVAAVKVVVAAVVEQVDKKGADFTVVE